MRVSRPRGGFTLVELLVVISIIGTLMSLLLPAVMNARERARQHQCSSNLRNVSQSVFSYETSKRHYPGYANPATVDPAQGTLRVASYIVPLLNQLDQNALQQSWTDTSLPVAERFRDLYMSILVCPSDTRGNATSGLSYVINSGVNYTTYPSADSGETNPFLRPAEKSAAGVSHARIPLAALGANPPGIYKPHEVSSDAISAGDGTSNTLLLSENLQAASWWLPATNNIVTDIANARAQTTFVWYGDANGSGILTPPTNAIINNGKDQVPSGTPDQRMVFARPSSNHGGLVNVAFCDNHVRSISDTIEYYVYAQLMTPNNKVGTVKKSSNRPLAVIIDPGTNLPYLVSEKDY